MADTYAEAQAQARRLVSDARLRDPDEHFPYKTTEARGALRRKSMPPDGGSDVAGQDYTSPRIIEATEAYVQAQEAMLRDDTASTRSAFEAAKDDLIAARRTHRRNRVDSDGNPVGGAVGLTDAPRPEHMRGVRLRRVGEE